MSGPELIDVLPKHRFDEERLWHYLHDHLDGFTGPARLRQFQGGQSNPTFMIETPDMNYVLRKQPPGPLLKSAHAVDREYRVQAALKGTPVPVVQMQLMCEDPGVIGTPFYVMDYVPGRIFFKPDLPDVPHHERKPIYIALAETLAALHEVDFRAVGLGDFGRTEGYAARQVKRWSEQYEATKTQTIEAMDKLTAWLKASIPVKDEAAITHGDYKLNNLMFELGIPSEEEIVAAYCHRAGRENIPDLTFFIALSFFRFAAIAQGVYSRALQGNAADTRAHLAGEAAIALAEQGWRIAHAAG
jgi:aminoglycoside phosphotransferase (APT) family kinase protein